MRVRTNTGVRPTDYFGNMFLPNTSEVYLAAIDSEKAVLAEIKHDDKLEDKSIVHIQVCSSCQPDLNGSVGSGCLYLFYLVKLNCGRLLYPNSVSCLAEYEVMLFLRRKNG